jgi:hypothetical protein
MDLDLDLNLANYDLPDLLALFKLDYDFDSEDLKRVKKMVLKTHPDKAPDLPKDYFLFFSEAYKMLYAVYQFRYKSTEANITHAKPVYYVEKDEEHDLLLQQLRAKPNFNKIFNDLFEQYRLKDADVEGGYGSWLKSDEDIDTRSTTLVGMNESFQTKKKEIQALVKREDYEGGGIRSGSSGYDLLRAQPECYSSPLFSNLGYEDLKKAHVESVIPVTQDDYLRRPQYRNVDELQRSSVYQDTTPLSVEQARAYLSQKHYGESKNDVNRAFTLAKQDEEVRKAKAGLMSKFKTLTLS